MSRDWVAWHAPYDEPGSSLAERLLLVQSHLSAALAAAAPGPINLVSACAGQGRDVLGVLPTHPRRGDVTALLVELDPANCARAHRDAAAAGLADIVHVVQGDAGDTAVYADAVPADVALFCGVFGNVPEADIRRTVATLPSLCAPGATVLWTRNRRAPDLTPRIRRWFADAGFTEIGFEPVQQWVSVGCHRLTGAPAAYEPGVRMFTFTDEP